METGMGWLSTVLEQVISVRFKFITLKSLSLKIPYSLFLEHT